MMKIKDLSVMKMLEFDRSDRQIQGGEGLSISVEVVGIEDVDTEISKSLYTTLDGSVLSVSVFSAVKIIPGGMISVSQSSSSATMI